jgi:hypothetical protein
MLSGKGDGNGAAMPAFHTVLVQVAREELARIAGRKDITAGLGHKRHDASLRAVLKQYWIRGAGRSADAAEAEIDAETAWSAAFISFCVREAVARAGTPAVFAFSAGHWEYAGAAIRNGFQAVPRPAFVGFPPHGAGAETPRLGDIVGWSRTERIADFADALKAARATRAQDRQYASHFDIVVAVATDKATLIGGNVSNTVKETTVVLTETLLPRRKFRFGTDKQGNRFISSGPFLAVVRHLT